MFDFLGDLAGDFADMAFPGALNAAGALFSGDFADAGAALLGANGRALQYGGSLFGEEEIAGFGRTMQQLSNRLRTQRGQRPTAVAPVSAADVAYMRLLAAQRARAPLRSVRIRQTPMQRAAAVARRRVQQTHAGRF